MREKQAENVAVALAVNIDLDILREANAASVDGILEPSRRRSRRLNLSERHTLEGQL